jgi:hypothetical protein
MVRVPLTLLLASWAEATCRITVSDRWSPSSKGPKQDVLDDNVGLGDRRENHMGKHSKHAPLLQYQLSPSRPLRTRTLSCPRLLLCPHVAGRASQWRSAHIVDQGAPNSRRPSGLDQPNAEPFRVNATEVTMSMNVDDSSASAKSALAESLSTRIRCANSPA